MIRTRELYVPNVALYHAEPHSVFCNYGKGIRTPTNRVRVCCATITPFRNVLCSLANKYYYTYISKNCKHFFNFFLFFCFFLQFALEIPWPWHYTKVYHLIIKSRRYFIMKTIWERFTDGFTLKKITWIVLGAAICSFGIYNIHQQWRYNLEL